MMTFQKSLSQLCNFLVLMTVFHLYLFLKLVSKLDAVDWLHGASLAWAVLCWNHETSATLTMNIKKNINFMWARPIKIIAI